MKFINPSNFEKETIDKAILEASLNTRLSFEFLKQEFYRAFLEDKIILIVDPDRFVLVPRKRLVIDGPEAIIEFMKQWAPPPDEVQKEIDLFNTDTEGHKDA